MPLRAVEPIAIADGPDDLEEHKDKLIKVIREEVNEKVEAEREAAADAEGGDMTAIEPLSQTVTSVALTANQMRALEALLTQGPDETLAQVAERAGLTYRTLRRYMLLPSFMGEYRARIDLELGASRKRVADALIRAATQPGPGQAAALKLYYQRLGEVKESIELSGPNGGPIKTHSTVREEREESPYDYMTVLEGCIWSNLLDRGKARMEGKDVPPFARPIVDAIMESLEWTAMNAPDMWKTDRWYIQRSRYLGVGRTRPPGPHMYDALDREHLEAIACYVFQVIASRHDEPINLEEYEKQQRGKRLTNGSLFHVQPAQPAQLEQPETRQLAAATEPSAPAPAPAEHYGNDDCTDDAREMVI